VRIGDVTAHVERDPWRLTLFDGQEIIGWTFQDGAVHLTIPLTAAANWTVEVQSS
jgi:hypothetical protein